MTRNIKSRIRLLACTAMTASAIMATPALAQDADRIGGLDVIVVTAQRDPENVDEKIRLRTIVSGADDLHGDLDIGPILIVHGCWQVRQRIRR